tara:strand:- start:462 stop:941 length:480 start_codon:yes stop_codon:yes gene_type:complete
MNLNAPELLRLLEIISQANMHNQNVELNEDLFTQLSVEYAKKSVIELGELKRKEEKEETAVKVIPGNFTFSTSETAKKLKVTDSDLRALRNAKELEEGWHYITGRSPRPTAIWYDLHRTCGQIHGVEWSKFSKPGFDVQANTERQTAEAFERARRNQKK